MLSLKCCYFSSYFPNQTVAMSQLTCSAANSYILTQLNLLGLVRVLNCSTAYKIVFSILVTPLETHFFIWISFKLSEPSCE
jgi:hypothetical protein